MRVTPEQAEPTGNSTKEVCNFRVWMYREVMGRGEGWDWTSWYANWKKYDDAGRMAMCARYEIECESGRYV